MSNNYKLFIYTLISIALTISSCELYNPSEPIPAYIHIDKITLITTASIEGSNSSKITDAWVYVDEQLIGCFELPATFPIINNGSHVIKIRPGIKVNGIAATRSPYPFYSNFDTIINLQKGMKINLFPMVKYRTNMTFNFMEDFENSGTIISKSPTLGVDTVIQVLNAPNPNIFEGNTSGIAYLDNSHTFFEGVSSTSYVLPKSGSDVFLELNYKCNHEFVVGVFAHSNGGTNQEAAITINPSASWNKVYIYLTPVVSKYTTATDYNIFLGMRNIAASDSVAMLLDNIKLVY